MSTPSATSTLAEADGWWIEARCAACQKVSYLPCRMLARELRPDTTVASVVARLLCRHCHVRPELVDLIDSPQYDAPGFVGSPGAKRISLLRCDL